MCVCDWRLAGESEWLGRGIEGAHNSCNNIKTTTTTRKIRIGKKKKKNRMSSWKGGSMFVCFIKQQQQQQQTTCLTFGEIKKNGCIQRYCSWHLPAGRETGCDGINETGLTADGAGEYVGV